MIRSRSFGIGGPAALLTLALACTLFAAGNPTGYRDDCDATLRGWAERDSYRASQADGVLTLDVHKQTKWEGLYLDLGGLYDFSKHPHATVRAKSTRPCLLHVYLHTEGGNVIVVRKLHAVSDFVDLAYDFTDNPKNVDLSKVKGMIFTANGASTSWSGTITIDRILVGSAAEKRASIEGIADQTHDRDSGRQRVLVTGLIGAKSVKVDAPAKLIRNAKVGPVKDGTAELAYDLVKGATGSGKVTATAVGDPGYADNSVVFNVTVEGNAPPTFDQPEDQVVMAGREHTLRLTGVDDGNIAAEQALHFKVTSSDEAVVSASGVKVEHRDGSPYAYLTFTPKNPGKAELIVVADDRAGGRSSVSKAFAVTAVASWNHEPTVDAVADQQVFLGGEPVVVELTGVSDGDGGRQSLSVAATSSDEAIVPSPGRIEVKPDGTARLALKPGKEAGVATITVTVADDGGADDNNGDRRTRIGFKAVTRVKPRLGLKEQFDDPEKTDERWRGETGLTFEAKKGEDGDLLIVEARDKITFAGLWFDAPDLDLREYPYVTIDIRPEVDMDFNVFLYDGHRNRNSGGTQKVTVPGKRWTNVTFDFSGEGQMADKKGEPIEAGWIRHVLFNFHPKLDWPFTKYNGTVYLRFLRIGKDANVPYRKPACTIDAAAARAHLEGGGEQAIRLTGLTDGGGGKPKLSVTSSDAAIAADPEVSPVNEAGEATLTYRVGRKPGRATLKITATARDAEPATLEVPVDVLDRDKAKAAAVTIDAAKKHQVVHGFGTWQNDLPVDLYAAKLGASAMRVGLISHQIEPANDNSDPNVLHRGALNYDVFDWDHLRKLREAGVETFVLTSWSPPAWMKDNLSLNYQQGGFERSTDRTNNRLAYHQYEEFAESMVAVVRMFEEEAGIELAAIGVQNEPAFHEPYASAILDPKRFCEVVKVVGRRFEREGIKTRLYFSEQVFSQTRSMNEYIDALNADAEAQEYCDIMATHGYDPKGTGEAKPEFTAWQKMWDRVQKGSGPKELWMTETYPRYRDYGSAFAYGMYLYGSLEFGNIGLWTSWGIEGQLINRGKPNDAFYVFSQYARFIRPGATRLTSGSGDADVVATSYLNDADDGNRLVSVLINRADEARAVSLSVKGRRSPGVWKIVTTDRVRRAEDRGDVAASELVLLPPKSVTTVIEQ